LSPTGPPNVVPSPSVLPTVAASLVPTVRDVLSTAAPNGSSNGAPNVMPNPSGTPNPSPTRPSILKTLEAKFRPKCHTASRGSSLSPNAVCWKPPAMPQPDELDHLIREASQLFSESSTWDEFVPKVRDPRGDFHRDVGKIPHPAAHLLNRFRVGGAPVACSGTPWSFNKKAAALLRGPHQSAKQHVPFLRQEFVDMIRKGQWTLFPARLVLNKLQLRLIPLGVLPQRDRRPRTISRYSFFGVNHETVALSPSECMQF
jgi:hypothetical protein